MVINDGSTDGTLAVLEEAFELVEVERVPRANLPSAPVRAVYASPLDDDRQWLAIVRTKALWTVLRPNTGWGEMTRAGFCEPVPAVAPGISSPIDG